MGTDGRLTGGQQGAKFVVTHDEVSFSLWYKLASWAGVNHVVAGDVMAAEGQRVQPGDRFLQSSYPPQ
jgi:hypothetical protein